MQSSHTHARQARARCAPLTRLLLLTLLLLTLAVPAQAAIAVDATASGAYVASATSKTWSHTTTGRDRALVVGLGISATTDLGTGCTYNAVAMTLIQSGQETATPTGWSYLYLLVNPASGANNIVCTTSALTAIEGVSASYTGAKQTGQPDSTAAATATAQTSLTVSTTVVLSNSWLVGVFRAGNRVDPGTGTFERLEGVDMAVGLFDSNGTVGTGSQSLQVTRAVNDSFYGGILSLASAAAGVRPPCCLLGVF